MKSVKRVFTKSLPRYNLRSRKSAVPVARNSTPKVNREVQASLSEEENCTLSFELPFHPSSLPPTAHVTSSSEEIEPIQSSGLPRFSTAFSDPNPANRTNTEAIDISIDPCEGPSIVQQSLPEPTTSFVPRQESDANPSEDFIPNQSSQSHQGPRTDLEVEETSDSEVDESLERRFLQIINSPEHFDALVRKSINYTEPKQTAPKQTAPRRRFRFESSSSEGSEEEGNEDNTANSEDEQEEDLESCEDINSETEQRQVATMEAELLREMQDEIKVLRAQLNLQSQAQQRTANALAQTPLPEVSGTHRPPPFHGYDTEDINRWLDKIENYLKLRRIDLASPTALAELVMNLAGPAEDYYYSLSPEEKASFAGLRDSLRDRFANDNQSWIIWQAVSTRQQGAMESLDTYLTDLTNKFRRLKIADADKMRYFVQGLRPEIRETVLLKQPRTFREAEEMARLACAVKTTMNNAPDGNMTAQIHNLSRSMDVPNSAILAKIEMLDEKLKQQRILAKPDPPAPENHTLAKLDALVNGFTSEASVHQVEALLARIDQLEKAARKTEGSRVTPLAAYSAGSPETRDVFKEIRQIKDTLLDMIQNLDWRMDARINGLARRQQPNREAELPRQRTREGRPVCYSCGRVGHVQQNCNQRYPREANQNFDRYQPHQQRRQPPDNNLPRSGYQSQRRDGLAPLDPRVLNSATVNEEAFPHSHMAPLAHNGTCYVFPQSEGKFPGLNSGRNDSQVDNEIFQQRQNVLRSHREVAREDKVAYNTLTREFFPASKQQSDDIRPHYKHAYANDGIYGNTSADHSENDLPGGLVTKTDADIATRPLGPTKTLKAEKKKPDSKKKCQPNRLISFPGAVRRAQKTIETNTSPSMNPENAVKNGSSPDPSPPQISTSAGCEPESVISAPDPPLPPPSTSAGCEPEPVTSVADPSVPPQPSTSAGYEENSPPSGPVPDETPCESIEAATVQCDVTSDELRPRDSMVTAQLNQKDSGPLVNTRANMSAIDEQSRDLFDGKLPTLQKTPADCQLSDSVEDVRCFEDSDNRSPHLVPHQFPDQDFRMFAMQEQINELGMKLNGIAKSIEPKQEVSYKWRKYSFKTKPVCYRCGLRGHIQYYCNYNQSNDGFQKERQVLHRSTRPTYCQPEESSTYEEENQSDVEGTPSQLESQENATNNPDLLQKMKPTRTSNRIRKPRNPNQKPRKLQIPNQSNVQLPLVNEADAYPSNLITKGKIAGKPVRLMLDTGASVSAIKEEVLKEIYGDVPFSTVQTGKDNLQLRRITLPLYLKESLFPCEFQVVQNLAYDVILGRDFLQVNRAMIDLDNNTITLKESANQQERASSASVPLTGTFKPQEKNVRGNEHASTSEGSLKPSVGILPSRSPNNKEVAISQSLLLLVLIAVSLSALFHTDANGNFRSVIQKPPPSFAQVSQKKVWHQGDLSDTPAKTDYRVESNEGFDQYKEAPPGMEMPKFMMHLRRLFILRPMTDFSNK